MFIIYSDTEEAIICTAETEPATIKLYFDEGGRDQRDYNREVIRDGAVHIMVNHITAKLTIE